MRRAAIAIAVAALAIGLIVPESASAAGAGRNDKAQAAGGVQVERNLTYREVGGEKLKLDAYLPVGEGIRPGVMVIYGGGWILGSKQLSGPMAEMLAEQGYVAFAMNYRLAPQHPFPAAVDDVRASTAWVRDHAAGVAAAVSWAGPMDLHPDLFGPDTQPYLDAFLDCFTQCDESKVVAASPISHVDPSDAPLFLANGDSDILVPPDQATRMSAALDAVHVPHQLVIVPNAGHDERLLPPVVEPSLQFLRQKLGGVDPSPTPGLTVGRGGSVLAPAIVVGIAALVVGAVLVALGRRGRRRRRRRVNAY